MRAPIVPAPSTATLLMRFMFAPSRESGERYVGRRKSDLRLAVSRTAHGNRFGGNFSTAPAATPAAWRHTPALAAPFAFHRGRPEVWAHLPGAPILRTLPRFAWPPKRRRCAWTHTATDKSSQS